MLQTLIMKAALIAFLGSISFAAHAVADTQRIEIPAGDLIAALESLAKQANVDLVYQDAQVKGLRTAGVRGNLSPRDAVVKLLEGTPLEVRTDEASGAILITTPTPRGRPGPVTSGEKSESTTPLLGQEREGPAEREGEGSKKGFWDRFRLAQNDQSSSSITSDSDEQQENSSQSSDKNSEGRVIDEVIVTAQKRTERLQDVPIPVTAIRSETLVDNNQLRLQDYYTRVPGLRVAPNQDQGNGAPTIAIRGITTGRGANSSVGIVVDDVPYGSSTFLGGGGLVPDIDPSELARIEVLRGPQGTFYGASSMGGLLKFVTADPSTEKLSGRVQAGISSVRNGDGAGYSVRGAVNVPLSETWAVRASAFTRRDPGYIDDPGLGLEGVNQMDVSGGRVSALWRPSETWALKLSALLQDIDLHGSPNVHVLPGLGDLEQNALRNTGWYKKRFEVYNANLTANFGKAELTAVSGYSVNTFSDAFDLTPAYGPIFTLPVFGVLGTPLLDDNETTKFAQEIRLTMPLGQRVYWLLGAFYTHEDSKYVQHILAVDPATGTSVIEWFFNDFPTTYSEYAAFTDLTFHITDRFDIQVGGRQSENKQTYAQTTAGDVYTAVFLGQPSPVIYPKVHTDESSFTYLVTPRFKLSPNFMAYARLASGYRPGGPNTLGTLLGVPPEYNPDKTQNYEIGIKGNAFNRALSFDASLYYIDWKDIQLTVNDPASGQAYIDNGSRAKSQGLELSLESSLTNRLTIGAWVAWSDTELSEDFPSTATVRGLSGDRLPLSTRFSGNISLDQEFSLGGMTGFAGASVTYVGDRKGEFVSVFAPPARQTLPSYAQTDLRAGLRHETWTFNVFVNNVSDKRGILSGGLGAIVPFAFKYFQPRTAGFSLTKSF